MLKPGELEELISMIPKVRAQGERERIHVIPTRGGYKVVTVRRGDRGSIYADEAEAIDKARERGRAEGLIRLVVHDRNGASKLDDVIGEPSPEPDPVA